jgi:hypothetical protein
MSQVRLRQVTGPATAAGTALATVNPTETGTWTEVAGLTAAIPTGGAIVEVTADTAAMRVAVIDNGRSPPPLPPHNGLIVELGATFRMDVNFDDRVFTKTL